MSTLYAGMMSFIDAQTSTYVSSKTQAVASAIQPAVVSLMGSYIILWGLAHIRGMVQEPVMEFVMRVIKIVGILAIGISLWGYNAYVTDTFMNSPDSLASALGGSKVSTINTLDDTLDKIFDIGANFWQQAGLRNIGAYLAALLVWLVGIVVTAYAAFLIILSKILLAVLIALGPIFIALLLFETTAKFFESWIAQLSNYALTVPLVTAVNVFILGMFKSAAVQAAALGTVQIADIFPLLVTSVISVLVLAQVPNVASGLAGGIAMSSYGAGRLALRSAGKPAKFAGKKAAQGAAKGTRLAARKAVTAYRSRRNKVQRAAA